MRNEFKPDWASPPGATLQDWLDEKPLSAQDLSEDSNIPLDQIGLILTGDLAIDKGLAQGFLVTQKAL